MFTLADEHFEDQAIAIKKLFYKYKAQRVVIDANGIGLGLVDYMVKSQIDKDTNEVYPKIKLGLCKVIYIEKWSKNLES